MSTATIRNEIPEAIKGAVKARLLAKIAKNDVTGCWDWQAASRGVGYGCLKIEGKVIDAHRASYMVHVGPIPPRRLVLHSCDNRACVNPEHLFLGMWTTNIRDAIDKGRMVPFKATRTEPLTDDELTQLRRDYRGGVSQRVLCRKYSVAPTTLKRLLKD